MGSRMTRRGMLGSLAASFAVPQVVPASVLGRAGQSAPSEAVRVAIIGLGGRALGLIREMRVLKDLRVVAICDCFRPLLATFTEAAQEAGIEPSWDAYEDFRRMIEKERPDGVMVETTTHARAWTTILAMQMNVDVYIEKPMALTVGEGRYMVEAARKYGRVTQVGTQQRSMPLNNWISDLIKSGIIGQVHTVLAPNFVGPERWQPKPAEPMPKGGSKNWWDIWTNQAELRPYRHQLHRGWARWWAYDGGGLSFGVTGWGTHAYDQVQRALGTDLTGPAEVWLEEPVAVRPGGKFETPLGKDDTGAGWRRGIRGIKGPRAKVSMRYASGTVLKCHLDADVGPGLGAIFIGEKGTIELNRAAVLTDPPDLLDRPGRPGPQRDPESVPHIRNWLECIKTRQRCNADIEIGQRSTTICSLINIVRELGHVGQRLTWDPQEEQFTNCPEANETSYMKRARRKGYELPPLV